MSISEDCIRNSIIIVLFAAFTTGGCSKSDNTNIEPASEIINGVNKLTMLNQINAYRSTGCTCGTENIQDGRTLN